MEEFSKILENNPSLLDRNKDLAAQLTRKPVLSESEKSEKKNSDPKYHNKKVYVYDDGFVSFEKALDTHGRIIEKYDSLKEYRRYQELRLLERAGEVLNLQRQVKLVIQPAFQYRDEKVSEISYVADHIYDLPNGEHVVEDVKAVSKDGKSITSTKDFKIKWKMLKAKYNEYLFTIY